jgi:hypothetical protein
MTLRGPVPWRCSDMIRSAAFWAPTHIHNGKTVVCQSDGSFPHYIMSFEAYGYRLAGVLGRYVTCLDYLERFRRQVESARV